MLNLINGTLPVDMRVYYINYVPYHSKNQINRGLHRWNQHHAGWKIPDSALFVDSDIKHFLKLKLQIFIMSYYKNK